MKIKTVALSLIVVLILLVSCNSEPKTGASDGGSSSSSIKINADQKYEITDLGQVLVDMSGMRNFKVNVDRSTAAIGMQAVSDGSRSMDDYLEKILVKQEEGSSTPEPIKYEAVNKTELNGQSINKGSVVDQAQIPGKLDKVYVMGDYTFVSYLTVDAQVLLNSTATQVKRESSGYVRYEGNIELRTDNNNGAGERDYIWYSYWTNNDYIYIQYNHSKWWNENGQYKEDRYDYSEDLRFRTDETNSPAINENGSVTFYDTFDYYTSLYRQSFIIDNNTGLIYEIKSQDQSSMNEPTYNFSIHAGVPFEQSLGPVTLSVNENHELVVDPLIPNSQIVILDTFKDKYGNIYIFNDSYAEKSDGIVMFVTPGEYVPTQTGEVLHITFTNVDSNNYDWWRYYTLPIQSVTVMNADLSERAVRNDDNFDIAYDAYITDFRNYSMGLYQYNNQNNKNNNNWSWNDNRTGSRHFFFKLKDGKLYTTYSKDSNRANLCILDLGTYQMSVYYYEMTGKQFIVLDEEHVLVASRNSDSGNMYSLYVISPFDDVSGGFQEYRLQADGISNNGYDSYIDFLKRNADIVGTSFGCNDQLRAEADNYQAYNWHYGTYTETIYDTDRTYYKKRLIGTSIGEDPDMRTRNDVTWDLSDYGWHFVEGGVRKYDYEYHWVEEDVKGVTFGFDPTMETRFPGITYRTQNGRTGFADYAEDYVYTYYSVVENPNGENTEDAYYRLNGTDQLKTFRYNGAPVEVGTSTGYNRDLASNSTYYTKSDYGWHEVDGGVYRYDYEYVWKYDIDHGYTFGYDAEKAAKGWQNYRVGNQFIGTAYYIQDYIYTYYEKELIGTSFGYDDDLSRRSDYEESNWNNRHWGTRTKTGYSNEYIYYNYRDGDDENTLRSRYNTNGSLVLNGSSLLDDVSIPNNSWNNTSDYTRLTFSVKDKTGTTSYKIIRDEVHGGYVAMKSSEYIAEKASLTLQPINK